ncbi:MAG TPA: copper-binding protein [Azospirillaceae bacterium]|nr:copper-binding protein [Azospirillaceae bacterium]
MIRIAALTVLAALTAGPVLAQSTHGGHGGHGTATQATQPGVTGVGVIKKVDAAKRKLNIDHEPIPAIRWPKMTMDFDVDPAVDLGALAPGQAVSFTLAKNAKGTYIITGISAKS